MLLKVHDLECSKCYKKVKKILCKFPHVYVFGVFVNKTKEIQDQVYDEKNNTVKIKVVCCSPEKIRDKIYCKGRGIIVCIEIVIKPPEKPKPTEKPKPPETPKPTEKPKPPETPKPPEVKIEDKNSIVINFKSCYCGRNCDGCCGRPVSCSCGCGGHKGNCGRPVCSCGCGGFRGNCVRLVHCSCGCGGFGGNCVRLVHCSCGCGGYRGNCGSRCHEYYCIEDNSHGCSIM
ncbi:hypothetical protein Q3G72_019497 [Acer saccharum]|nr:hypothetical protein Q3G72_019497 [Acer saccharum]